MRIECLAQGLLLLGLDLNQGPPVWKSVILSTRPQQHNRSCCGSVDRGAVMAQWIRPRTLNREVPSSNLLAAAVCIVPSGKALYPHCPVPRKGLKVIGPLVACL